MTIYRLPDDRPSAPLVTVLYRNLEGEITLQVENDRGLYNVASLTVDGRLALHPNIPPGIGLKVDQNGRIRTVIK